VLFKGVHYEVIVETKRGVAKTVTLHVLGNEDVYNEEANEYMSAADFSMDIEDVDSITPQDLILRANAQAWKGDESEEEISISEVIYDIKAEAGKYPIVFKTANGTSVGADVNVVQPKVIEDEKEKIGIQAFDVYRTIDEIEESMAISVDLKNWADAYAWDLETENEVEIDDVRFDFDPMEIKEGTYEVTFVTEGRTYKIHTTEKQNEGDIVSLDFDPDDIHVMEKSVGL
jgi:flagellar capping protein FliD